LKCPFRLYHLKEKKRCTFFIGTGKLGSKRVDFFVEEKAMVELKAVEKLEGVCCNALEIKTI